MLKNLFKRTKKNKSVDIQKLNEELLANNQRLLDQYAKLVAASK